MTWIGKILAVMVLLLTLAWMWLTVNVFVTRNNWRTQAEIYKKAFDDAKIAREAEFRIYQSEKDALARQLVSEQALSKASNDKIVSLDQANKDYTAKLATLGKAYKDSDLKAVQLQANLDAAMLELKNVRTRSTQLEDERVRLVVAKETAEKDRQAAENAARQAQGDRLLAERRVEDLTAQLNEVRTNASGGGVAQLGLTNRPTPPVPEGLRGSVLASKDGYVVVNVGIDAGVVSGMSLDVFREKAGQYLGKITITGVEPKQAIGIFQGTDAKRGLKQLRPEELPKVDDTVGSIGAR